MPGNEFAEALAALQRQRTEVALSALTNDDAGPRSAADRLAAALDTLAEGVKQEGALWEQHKKKGWQSTKASLLATGGKLNDLAKEVDAYAEQRPAGERDPKRGIEPGGDPNQPGVAERGDPANFVYRTPEGWPPAASDIAASLARLEAERADRPAGMPVLSDAEALALLPVLDAPETTEQLGAEQVDQLERIAVESGNEVGAPMVTPVVPSAESLAIFSDGAPTTALLDTVHTEVREAMADADPFTDPVTAVTLAKPLTFADLLKPIPMRADVPHWSASSLSTLDDCGVKYAASKMLEMPRVPQWSLVGGKALHAAIDLIERRILAPGSAPENWGTPAEIWSTAFQAAIVEQAAEAPLPPAQWRAANKGAEGFDWWRVEGERMLGLYVDVRRKTIDAAVAAGVQPRQLLQIIDLTVLEAELRIDVPGPMGSVPFVSILDQAWTINGGQDGVLIVDVKTGKSMPPDTFQLGSQAIVLAQHMGLPDPETANKIIQACYYDARKGVFTEAFRPIERHPYEELVYRVHTAEHQRRSGVYRPRVSPFCNGCDVKYACPLMNGARP